MKNVNTDVDDTKRTGDHWDAWQIRQSAGHALYTDWADHPTVFRAMMRHALGHEDTNFFTFLKQNHPNRANAHALSLCCGDGAFEQQLLEQGVFARITGLELSNERIVQGRARLSKLHSIPLDFVQKDVNQGNYGWNRFDVVFAKAALHHVHNLEDVFKGIVHALKPGGLLMTIDFFGPTRFQWTDTQLEICNQYWQAHVPSHLQCEVDGTPTPPVARPLVEDMIALDPSEAVRSGELHSMIYRYFDVLDDRALGGTLMNLLLYGDRVNRFDPSDPSHNAVLEQAVAFEHELINKGVLDSDFRLIVARPKAWWRRFNWRGSSARAR